MTMINIDVVTEENRKANKDLAEMKTSQSAADESNTAFEEEKSKLLDRLEVR